MKIKINISVRNPDWHWENDDYREEWLVLNEDKVPKFLNSVSFALDADIQQHVKPESDEYVFKFIAADEADVAEPAIQEVLLNGLDVTEFIHAEGTITVIISKSILHHVMAAQNKGRGNFYWYYYIKEDVDFFEFKRNIWLSKEHFRAVLDKVPNLEIHEK